MDKIDARVKIDFLVSELNRLTELYDKGTPEVSDTIWDTMYFELVDMEREWGIVLPNSPTQTINYTVVNELEKVKHNHPMLSLDKTKDWNGFLRYFSNLDASKDVVGMLKLDGLTCSLRYVGGKLVSAETRGDGETGENILHNALVINNIPKRINYQDELIVDGEIICTYKDFEKFQEEYANPRNFASGSIRLLDSKECATRKLRFVLWNVVKGPHNKVMNNLTYMQQLGFEVVPWTSSFDWDAKEFLIERADEYGYPIDGLVGRFNDIKYGESLGATDHHSRATYAFKFIDELYQTKLLDVEWTLGKTGQITPTAIFEPVEISGSTVSRASVHNISILKNLNLKIGGICDVFKANEIIPQVSSCSGGNKNIEIPKACPVCNGETRIIKDNDTEVLICSNPNCSGKFLSKLKFFVSKPAANIDGLSEASLEKFLELGWITKFVDIYHLKDRKDEMEQLEGFGKKSVEKLLNAIEDSRNIDLANFIAALSIPNVGKTASKTISKAFNGDICKVLDAYEQGYDWTQLDDFGDVMHKNINEYFKENIGCIFNLAKEFKFNEYKSENIADNPLNGVKFCITGSFSQSRDKIREQLEAKGAKFINSVSKNLDMLFCGEKAGSKLTKAQQLGVKTLNEEALWELLKNK